MENVMVMSNNFAELSDIEMLEIDGGFDIWGLIGDVCSKVLTTCACVVSPPLGIAATAAVWTWKTYKVGKKLYNYFSR